jgi:hypothetical protein
VCVLCVCCVCAMCVLCVLCVIVCYVCVCYVCYVCLLCFLCMCAICVCFMCALCVCALCMPCVRTAHAMSTSPSPPPGVGRRSYWRPRIPGCLELYSRRLCATRRTLQCGGAHKELPWVHLTQQDEPTHHTTGYAVDGVPTKHHCFHKRLSGLC